jgi:hypothetical protein
MMAATADSLPLDVKGNPIPLETIKELLAHDVLAIRTAMMAVEADLEAVAEGRRCYPNVMLRRIVDYLELAHDLHWDWYRARANAAATGA